MTSTVIRRLLLAWHFLTVFRLSRTVHDASPRELARSMGWYPVIGLCLGIVLAVADQGLAVLFTPSLVDVILIVILVAATGALHQDGLADTLDGIGGGRTPGERLRIMRDPSIGAIGATGLVLDVALRLTGLQAVPEEMRPQILFCFPMFGRWGIVIGAWGTRYARSEGGTAAPFLAELSWREVTLATALLAPVAVWQLGWLAALVCGIVATVVARGMTRLAERLCGGLTGDLMGATNELVEIAVVLLVPVL